jgi:hypothetical protein
MIAITKQPRQTVEVQFDEQFLQMMPAITRLARLAFRNLPPDDREEATSEVVCGAFAAFRRLVELNKQDLAFATPLARFGVARFRSGRRNGNRMNPCDVSSVVAQRRWGFVLENLPANRSGGHTWCDVLTDDRLTPVLDQVAFRIDFSNWLKNQNRRKQYLIELLAVGNTATEAAKRLGVSRARISQLRSELQASWEQFQGEAA